jgi:tetratricopeptide (TPR) repeat protein
LQKPQAKRARQAFNARQFDTCLDHLAGLYLEDPTLPPPPLLLAEILFSQGRLAEMQPLLEQAAGKYKMHPEVYLVCGQVELMHARLANAAVHFEKALALPLPGDWPESQQAQLQIGSLQGLATVAERRGDWADADKALATLSELLPNDLNIVERRARALFHAGNTEDALEQFGSLYGVDDSRSPAEAAIAMLYAQSGNFVEADNWFKKAVAKFPKNGRMYFDYAATLLTAGRTERAVEFADKAEAAGLVEEPFSTEIEMIRGIVAAGDKDYEAAEKRFTKALSKSPGHLQALRRLPLAMIEQSDPAKQRRALQIATIHAQKHPQSAPAQTTLAWVQFKSGKADEARETLKKCPPGTDPEALYIIAFLMVELGQAEAAKPAILALQAALKQPGWFPQRSEAEEWVGTVALTLE